MTSKTQQAWKELVDRWNNSIIPREIDLTISKLTDNPEAGEPHTRMIFANLCSILARMHEHAFSKDIMTAKLYDKQAERLLFKEKECIPHFYNDVFRLFPKILRIDNDDPNGHYFGLTLKQAKNLFEFLDSKEGRVAFAELGMMSVNHAWMPMTK